MLAREGQTVDARLELMDPIRDRPHSLINGLVPTAVLIDGNDIPILQEAKNFLRLDMSRFRFASRNAYIRVKKKVSPGMAIQFREVLLALPDAPFFPMPGDLHLRPKNIGVGCPFAFGPRRVRPSHGLDNKVLDQPSALQSAKDRTLPLIETVAEVIEFHLSLSLRSGL